MKQLIPKPAPRGFRQMVRAHLLFGTVGFCVGLLCAFALIEYGPEFTQASPFFTALALVLVSTIAGTMTGGLLMLAPRTADERR